MENCLINRFKQYNMRPELSLPERQAYEGAKSFYLCFLPLVMTSLTVTQLLFNRDPIALVYTALMLGSYALALRYFRKCNQIDSSAGYFSAQYQSGQTTTLPSFSTLSITLEEEVSLENSPTHPARFKCRYHNCAPKQPGSQGTINEDCYVMREYRTKHCSKCQTCIFRYDHHCFWIGNCVGYRNHRQFYAFLALQSINNVLVFLVARTIKDLLTTGKQGGQSTIESVGWWLLLGVQLLAFGFVVFTGYLLLYHSMLMATGMTTWEHMSRSRITYLKHLKSGINPFSKGVLRNIYQFWVHADTPPVYTVPSFVQAQQMQVGCNLIENSYYSCC